MSHFNDVFIDQECSYFRNMLQIFERSRTQEYKSRYDFLEEHHIIPKCWFKLNGLVCDNSEENKVHLSCKDHLKVHVLLVHYFTYIENEVMQKKMMSAICIMTKIGSHQMKRCGDISKEEYEEYERIRTRYYQEGVCKNRKYSEEFIRKCFDVFKEFDDSHEAFDYIKKNMDIKDISTEDHFLQRLKKYIPEDEFTQVRNRQKLMMNQNRKNKTLQRSILIKQKKNEEKLIETQKKHEITVLELKDMYKRYQTYGVKYMKMKYPSFSTSTFLKKCGKFGIIDYKPTKDTTKKKILYGGQQYGLCELCRKLNVSGSDYRKIISVHKTLGIRYEKIFTEYVYGNLGKYEIRRKQNNHIPSFFTLRGSLLQLSELGKDYGYDYVKVCEMHMSGMDVEEIRKKVFEVSGNEMM